MLGWRVLADIPQSSDLASELLRVDSMWEKGQTADALKLLDELESHPDFIKAGSSTDEDGSYKAFHQGLRALVQGDMDTAYENVSKK